MVETLFKQSLKVVAQQVVADLQANPAQWQTQNGYFVRTGGPGPLAVLQPLPFWIVFRNGLGGGPAIATVPSLGPNNLPTLLISAELAVFVPGPALGALDANNVARLQLNILQLPLATRQNNAVQGWTHSSWDGVQAP
jgi:hypothetical protein